MDSVLALEDKASPPSIIHEILILGGNFAGVNLTHYLLRQTTPILTRMDPLQTYHITLISPNTHFYFKIAGPRAMINETSVPADKIFKSIPESLAQYGEHCTFVQGRAVNLDPVKRVVRVEESGQAMGTRDISYHSIFMCTGTTSGSPLWGLHGDHEITLKAMEDMHKQLPNAETVLIAGAGAVGVEVAGEIASAFPKIKITLVSGSGVLDKAKPGTAAKMKKMLDTAGVEVVTGVRVTGTSTSATEGKTTVRLTDGSTRDVDIYLDASGASKVNSEFLPETWLDETKHVCTLDAYFRVQGDCDDLPPTRTYVLGDMVSGSLNTAIEVDAQVPVAASSFAVDIAAILPPSSTPCGGGILSWIGLKGNSVSQKEYKPLKDTMIVPFGPEGGAGHVMGWQIPSLMVRKAKAEKFFVETVEPLVSGNKYSRA